MLSLRPRRWRQTGGLDERGDTGTQSTEDVPQRHDECFVASEDLDGLPQRCTPPPRVRTAARATLLGFDLCLGCLQLAAHADAHVCGCYDVARFSYDLAFVSHASRRYACGGRPRQKTAAGAEGNGAARGSLHHNKCDAPVRTRRTVRCAAVRCPGRATSNERAGPVLLGVACTVPDVRVNGIICESKPCSELRVLWQVACVVHRSEWQLRR